MRRDDEERAEAATPVEGTSGSSRKSSNNDARTSCMRTVARLRGQLLCGFERPLAMSSSVASIAGWRKYIAQVADDPLHGQWRSSPRAPIERSTASRIAAGTFDRGANHIRHSHQVLGVSARVSDRAFVGFGTRREPVAVRLDRQDTDGNPLLEQRLGSSLRGLTYRGRRRRALRRRRPARPQSEWRHPGTAAREYSRQCPPIRSTSCRWSPPKQICPLAEARIPSGCQVCGMG